jgi:hypothetical protein
MGGQKMSEVIIYEYEGGVAVVVPAPDVDIKDVAARDIPQGCDYKIVDSAKLPDDRVFRGAWTTDCKVDMDKAKEIWLDKIRDVRNKRLAELDIEWMRAMENGENKEASNIAAIKQSLRDITERADIHKCKTTASLRKYWPQILEG